MHRMPFFIAGVMVVLMASTVMASEAKSPKTGYVDLQRALHEVEDGKAARELLKREFDKKQTALNAMQDRIKKLENELETQGMMMKEEIRRQKVDEYRNLMMELQQKLMEDQQDLAEKEAEATGAILSKMEGIVRQIAQEQSFAYIFERNRAGLIVAPPSMDITNEVIRRYNELPKGSSAKKPKK